MPSRVGLEFVLRGRGAASPRRQGEAFRLLLLGDFGGRGGEPSPEKRALGAPVRVDAVDFEKAFARFEPRLVVSSPSGVNERLSLASLDELHPDRLFENLERFAAARDLRGALEAGGSPQVFERARAFLAQQGAAVATQAGQAPSSRADDEAAESTLQRLLGASPGPGVEASPTAAASPAQALLERAVRPHVVPEVAAERGPLLAELDRAISDEMRQIVGSESYRALESLWRSAERVACSLDSDEELEVWLFDVTRAELAAAFEDAGSDLETSRVHARLVNGEQHWTVVAADLTFAANDEDLTLLAQLTATVARAGGVLLADAAPSLVGAASVAACAQVKSWNDTPLPALGQALRTSPLARQLGLVFPRVLVRRPYGKKRDAISAFAFEEITQAKAFVAAERVWGSGAFAAAELLGRRFRDEGWEAGEARRLELDDLPLDTFDDDDGERHLVPCAEVALAEPAAAALLERGVTPLLSRRDQASVRLVWLVSFSSPPEPLTLTAAAASEA